MFDVNPEKQSPLLTEVVKLIDDENICDFEANRIS
jgi:hypothetical protein